MLQLPTPRRQPAFLHAGFTLFEVMIALLVLSIGLLGLAALQTSGLRAGQVADMRTRAVQAAADMVERMHANPAALLSGHYETTRNHPPRHGTATGMVATDLTDWHASLARLPDGRGEITRCNRGCTGNAGQAVHIVTVWWNESRNPATRGLHCPPRSVTDLRCFRLVTR